MTCLCAGTLPISAWANLSGLMTLKLSGNRLEGTLPHDLATTCPKLWLLSLSDNAHRCQTAHYDWYCSD